MSLVAGAERAADGSADARRAVGRSAFDAQGLMIEGLLALDRRAAAGDERCLAALSLLAPEARAKIAAVSKDLAARLSVSSSLDLAPDADGVALSGLCYALAVEADASGRANDAALILCVLVGSSWGELDGCLGLAVIAARMKKFEEALVLAERCMASDVRHPRIFCIVGICLLEQGNMAAAQTHLAAAARLARTKPEFREDLQAAQRALLLMHLS